MHAEAGLLKGDWRQHCSWLGVSRWGLPVIWPNLARLSTSLASPLLSFLLSRLSKVQFFLPSAPLSCYFVLELAD